MTNVLQGARASAAFHDARILAIPLSRLPLRSVYHRMSKFLSHSVQDVNPSSLANTAFSQNSCYGHMVHLIDEWSTLYLRYYRLFLLDVQPYIECRYAEPTYFPHTHIRITASCFLHRACDCTSTDPKSIAPLLDYHAALHSKDLQLP